MLDKSLLNVAKANDPSLAAALPTMLAHAQYSREFETEADDIGSNFMARAGYHPEGMARFFERIVRESHDTRFEMPPYLYSHPDVESRIASVRHDLDAITVTGEPDP